MKIYGMTDKGMERATNQDCFYIDKSGNWCVIADGMGGHNGGETASSLAVEVIKESLLNDKSNIEESLKNAITKANNAVFKMSREKPELDGMGTTVVLLRLKKNIAYIAHVGDSRAYYISDGKIVQLTKDHSIVQQLIESGTITSEQAKTHPQKNLITRAVGSEPYVEIDINRVICTKGDFVLLCTDGLSSLVEETDILSIVTKDPQAAVSNLVDAANNAGGKDNITAVLINL